MGIGNWISVLMALIAVSSTAITYLVYRSATDPNVIVYADADKNRPSVINLIIKNIGKGSAVDISFLPTRPLPSKAFGIEVPDKLPAMMTAGPIVTGIPYLAPNQEIVITWGQFGGLANYIEDSSIIVNVIYHRSKRFGFFSSSIKSISKLDVHQFNSTDASDHHWGKNLVKTLEVTNQELVNIQKRLGEN